MVIEAIISRSDQRFVETLFVDARLVARDEEDGCSLRIECECEPPDAISRLESKLLHVSVLRAVERIAMRALQTGAEFREQGSKCRDFGSHLIGKLSRFSEEPVFKLDAPHHTFGTPSRIMLSSAYVFDSISSMRWSGEAFGVRA